VYRITTIERQSPIDLDDFRTSHFITNKETNTKYVMSSTAPSAMVMVKFRSATSGNPR